MFVVSFRWCRLCVQQQMLLKPLSHFVIKMFYFIPFYVRWIFAVGFKRWAHFFFHSPYTIHGTKYDSLNIFLSWFHLIPLEFIYNSLKASSVAYCVMSISSSCTAFASFYEIPLFHCSNEKGGVLFFHQDFFFRSMNNGLFRFNER